MTTRFPRSGFIFPTRGLKLSGRLFEVKKEDAVSLQNLYYKRDSLVQRGAFRQHSSVDYSSLDGFRNAFEYVEAGGSSRELYGMGTGAVLERTNASTNATRFTFASSDKEIDFEQVFDSVVVTNGTDVPQIGRGTTYRQMGSPASVSTLAITPSGSGSFTGSYLHLIVAVIEEAGGKVYSNWSNVVATSPAGQAQFDVTWTDVARATHYYYFRSEDGGQTFYSVARIASGIGSYTDTTTDTNLPDTVANMPQRPDGQNLWGEAPVSRYVTFSGNRAVFLGVSGALNTLKTSRFALNSYEAEGVPTSGTPEDTTVELPGKGPITAGIPVGETGEGNPRGNHLFVTQRNACYILQETNPKIPIQDISRTEGCIGFKAIARWQNWVFFQSAKGVMMWPGAGKDLYLLSDKIKPVFEGGGHQGLSANFDDEDIIYTVFEDLLLITVDVNGVSSGYKTYVLDLDFLRRNFDPLVPTRGIRWAGPWVRETAGSAFYLVKSDNSLIMYDNHQNDVLKWEQGQTQDEISGVDTNITAVAYLGPQLKDDPIPNKHIQSAQVMAYTNEACKLELIGEFESIIAETTTEPQLIGLQWGDIVWGDLSWIETAWHAEAYFEWFQAVGKFFLPKLTKTDSNGFAFHGLVLYGEALDIVRNFR